MSQIMPRVPAPPPRPRGGSVATPAGRLPSYLELVEAQGGVCAGCWQAERQCDRFGQPLRLQVYVNTTVRPPVACLFCKSCTLALALAREDPDTLDRLHRIVRGERPQFSAQHEVRAHLEGP